MRQETLLQYMCCGICKKIQKTTKKAEIQQYNQYIKISINNYRLNATKNILTKKLKVYNTFKIM